MNNLNLHMNLLHYSYVNLYSIHSHVNFFAVYESLDFLKLCAQIKRIPNLYNSFQHIFFKLPYLRHPRILMK